MIGQWLAFTTICAGIGVIGWLFWNDIGAWFTPDGDVCLGCSRHRLVPGCPIHDSQRRNVA